MTLAELKTEVDNMTAEVTRDTDVKSAAANLIGTLGQLIVDNAGNAALITEIGNAMTTNRGQLASTNETLAAAIVAGTPAQP